MSYTPNSLLALSASYCDARGSAESTIARLSSGSGATFTRLRNGHDITIGRAERIAQWFSDHWPSDLDWPEDIPRPTPTPDNEAA